MNGMFQPDGHEQPLHEHHASEQTANVAADVQVSISRFWDTVRSSAELIVTLRQEVVQLRSQNAALTTELEQAQELERTPAVDVRAVAAFEETIAELSGVNEKLQAELSQARVDMCELELVVSSRDAELQSAAERFHALEIEYAAALEEFSKRDVAAEEAARESHEQAIQDAHVQVLELRSTIERMKTEKSQLNEDYLLLAEKYQAIESEVDRLQHALGQAQEALRYASEQQVASPASNEMIGSLELEALRHRLSELEAMAATLAETELASQQLQEQLDDLQEQLTKALEIVDLYRAAGMRHIEDPDYRNQMSLFSAGKSESIQLIQSESVGKGLSPEEMEALAERLDNLAARVAQLLGIS